LEENEFQIRKHNMLIRRLAIASSLIALLDASPARRESYEPIPPPSASSQTNLFLNAPVSASGHWSDQTPNRAVDGKLDPAQHWACENLPVWHQVNLTANMRRRLPIRH
jgi:hypothetical protein